MNFLEDFVVKSMCPTPYNRSAPHRNVDVGHSDFYRIVFQYFKKNSFQIFSMELSLVEMISASRLKVRNSFFRSGLILDKMFLDVAGKISPLTWK